MKVGRLILQRGLGQEVVLKHAGEIIGVIGVSRIGAGSVALSFQMPPDVVILRRELDVADSYGETVAGAGAMPPAPRLARGKGE